MIRATTGGVMKTYRYNLMNSFIRQNNAMNTILTHRNFNSFAEDPASAARAFRLRKSRMTVTSQLTICTDTKKKYETAYSSLQSINDVLQTKDGQYGQYLKTLKGTTLDWLNDPTGDAREQLTKVLDQMSEMLVQDMNQKYGDDFIFAGADGHNVPFEVKEIDGHKKLFYRGVDVDAAVPEVVEDANGPLEVDAANNLATAGGGSYIKMDTSALISKQEYDDAVAAGTTVPNVLNQAAGGPAQPMTFNAKGEPDPGGAYYLDMDKAQTMTTSDYEKQKLDAEKLNYLANEEKCFVDIGLGFQEDKNGKLIESSGFDAALQGINFLGCGLDEDGDPKNLYSLVQQMKELSDSVPEGGSWDGVWDEFDRLVGKFETACSNFTTQFANLAAGTTKLENNEELLTANKDNLTEQYSDIEDVDDVEAISAFLWAQYAYNSALKVGNSVLSQSLMDYLN